MEDDLNELTYGVIGAAMEVHKELGPGFLEAVYENSLREELSRRGIPFQPQPTVNVTFDTPRPKGARILNSATNL